jgi:hypothetical protein
VTEIREPNFTLDLPGEWVPEELDQPGAYAYSKGDGDGLVTVTLLGVRPVYTLSDPKRLMDDYLHHRSNFEKGQAPSMEQSEPVSVQRGDTVEGGWEAFDLESGHHVRHRVVLMGSMLADFRYEAPDEDEMPFEARAEAILFSATVSAE